MRIGKAIACFAACGASALAFAAVDVAPVSQAAAAFNECTRITNELLAAPVPAGHAEATLALSINAQVTDPKQKVAIDPAHAQFSQAMQAQAKRLDACKKSLEAAVRKAQEFLVSLVKLKLSPEDNATVQTAAAAYAKGQEELHAATQKLAQDKIKQFYVDEGAK